LPQNLPQQAKFLDVWALTAIAKKKRKKLTQEKFKVQEIIYLVFLPKEYFSAFTNICITSVELVCLLSQFHELPIHVGHVQFTPTEHFRHWHM